VAQPDYYPIFLDLTGRRCVVVGGGAVAEGKVRGLLAANATIALVAPQLTPALRDLVASEQIRHREGEYDASDLEDADLCLVATDDGAINARVAADARTRRILVNAADDPANCDFILPAVVRSGSVVVAASTGGASPALARRLREDLTAFLDEGYGPLGDLLGAVRNEVRAAGLRVAGGDARYAGGRSGAAGGAKPPAARTGRRFPQPDQRGSGRPDRDRWLRARCGSRGCRTPRLRPRGRAGATGP